MLKNQIRSWGGPNGRSADLVESGNPDLGTNTDDYT
jgi:hypothetical protein